MLVHTLRPGDLVVRDNLGSHKGEAVRAAIKAACARLIFLPAYSPDLNPIEQVLAKFILATVLTEGLPAVDAACAEALAQGVHSAEMILNILARSRDPAPPPPLLTSPALRLVHEPVAHCYRYDLLQRAG